MAAVMDYEILPFLSLKSYCIPVHMRVIILGECVLFVSGLLILQTIVQRG